MGLERGGSFGWDDQRFFLCGLSPKHREFFVFVFSSQTSAKDEEKLQRVTHLLTVMTVYKNDFKPSPSFYPFTRPRPVLNTC